MIEAKYYYESHITIDPVFDERRELASEIAKQFKFKLAHLLMQKSVADTPIQSKNDTFMTGHGKQLDDIKTRTSNLVINLRLNGFTVRRYKIEDTVLDSRIEDEMKLLA